MKVQSNIRKGAVMDRRTFLGVTTGTSLALVGTEATAQTEPATYQNGMSPWPLCLNASTIRPAPLREKIAIAAETGYDGIELWINELEKHEAEGGDLETLGTEVRDLGLTVPNVIGLWSCMPAGKEAFEQSLESSRKRMRMSAAVGSKHVAAIPAPDRPDFEIEWGTECYRRLLEIGRDEFGIIVAVEFVGFLKGIHRLGQAAAIAIDADDPDACVIADTFHLFRGGSGFNGIRHLDGKFIADFHWNDVLAEPPREEQGDEHRVYPGDGILPLNQLLQDLKAIEYTGPLSLELFSRDHWKQDLKQVAATGLEKMRENIRSALVT
jgi:sugar phosphate isomerase/epimerase